MAAIPVLWHYGLYIVGTILVLIRTSRFDIGLEDEENSPTQSTRPKGLKVPGYSEVYISCTRNHDIMIDSSARVVLLYRTGYPGTRLNFPGIGSGKDSIMCRANCSP